MASKKQHRRQHPPHNGAAGQPVAAIPGRRLPLAPPKREPLLPAWPPSPTEANNPYVLQIVAYIQRVCAISHFSPFTVLNDWVNMLEAALRLYADNARSYATTGQFIDDPPEVKEIYRRARERYLTATARYPATYREMQIAFSHTFALLVSAAGPGLGPYAAQTAVSPDLVGQVCLACLGLGPAWWPYFPPWPAALEAAQAAFPDGHELVCQVLVQGHLKYREARPADYIHPEPGEPFERWFAAVLPYCEPLIIGPTRIDSGALMLAAAVQFPDWAVQDGLVLFYPEIDHPLLDRLARISAMLYGLNGYELEMARTVQEIADYMQQQPESGQFHATPYAPLTGLAGPPAAQTERPAEIPLPTTTPLSRPVSRVKPDQASFADLFKKTKEA